MKLFRKPHKLLVIDDDEDDFFLIKTYLKDLGPDDYVVNWVKNYEEGLQAITHPKYDVYLIDQLLGAGSGLELITEGVKAGNKFPKILLTGMGNRQLDINAIKAGADDYLVKDQMSTEMLERTIRHALERYEQKVLNEEQHLQFKALFEQSTDPIYITDEFWKISQVNVSFLKLFDFAADIIKGMPLEDIFKNPNDFVLFSRKNIQKGFVQNFSADLIKSNGDVLIALISSTPILSIDKSITGYQGIIHDVTRLKKAEYDLMLADQYSLTNRMARMIAHEVRNPLTNITLAVAQMADTNTDTVLYMDMINRNSVRIDNLINELLNSTKIDSLQLSEAQIEAVIVKALELCNDRIKLKEVNVKTGLMDGKTLVKADAEKLAMAFTNILTNAIEATEGQQNPEIIITGSPQNEYFKIEITDNGKGMDEEALSNLFKAFYSRRKGGMGLGMTTVQNVILHHHGEIEVKSEPGIGTTFTLYIPLASTIIYKD